MKCLESLWDRGFLYTFHAILDGGGLLEASEKCVAAVPAGISSYCSSRRSKGGLYCCILVFHRLMQPTSEGLQFYKLSVEVTGSRIWASTSLITIYLNTASVFCWECAYVRLLLFVC